MTRTTIQLELAFIFNLKEKFREFKRIKGGLKNRTYTL